MRTQLLALRYDADASALMAAELARDNRAELTTVLGREPDAAELYLGHFLGISGASRFLAALSSSPDGSAAALMPSAAAANRAMFYSGSGAPRSISGVLAAPGPSSILPTRLSLRRTPPAPGLPAPYPSQTIENPAESIAA